MRSQRITRTPELAVLVAALAASMLSMTALTARAADDPDLRNLEPFVMIIVDSSGSMERLPACECVTPSCVECLPKCGMPAAPIAERKNRWAFTLEALTGQFNDFQCSTVARTTTNIGSAYDVGYYLPFHQPWKCRDADGNNVSTPAVCAYPTVGTAVQETNGVLDTYAARLRFGLMTFDGIETYKDANLVKVSAPFNEDLSESEAGMWSYGGFKRFHYPKCAEDYAMDTGVRSSIAGGEGGLITIDSNACPSPPCSIYQVNDSIQNALLRTRPYGGTPIAASLTDLYYHFKTDLDDKYGGCRDRYALLITDGYPDLDYRDYGCDCAKEGPGACGTDDPLLQKCPYDKPEEVANQLVQGLGQDPAQMKQLFVIGISINDAKVKQRLNDIAQEGGSVVPDALGNYARFADNFAVLTSTLDSLFGGLTKPVSRSVPAFVSGKAGQQYRLSAGFQKALGAVQDGIAPPWTGLIERQRFGCTDNVPGGLPLDSSSGDIFQDTLNGTKGDTRRLWTAFPSGSPNLELSLNRGFPGASCSSATGDSASLYCVMEDTDLDGDVSAAKFGFTVGDVETPRVNLVKWMYGRSGSVREKKRLGDIYHSSPTVWRAGPEDVTDDTYKNFLARPEVGKKPLMMYVGTNDGILHAFVVEPYKGLTEGNTLHLAADYVAGEELWGFVPPMMLDNLADQLQIHKFGMDATPVIKDAFYYKPISGVPPAGSGYHTVLVTGMRGGGEGYIALDISDPISPKFLWQFTDDGMADPPGKTYSTAPVTPMGKTYGRPVIAQLEVKFSIGSTNYEGVRGVVILPGGMGSKPAASAATPPPGCRTPENNQLSYRDGGSPYRTARGFSLAESGSYLDHRDTVPCWNDKGRALYFVDLETGYLIKKIDLFDGEQNRVFPSPLVGSPTVYPDAVGSVAKEGFVMDADGVIWRIDLSSKEPKPDKAKEGWTVRPFHDLFWGAGTAAGETSYEIPILSIDENKRLVVIAATGDTDNFDKPDVQNRVVSLTQLVTGVTPDDYKAVMNWEMRERTNAESIKGLIKSELVTGSMALFQGRLFLGTFAPIVNPMDPCQFGRGRLWSVHYNKRDPANQNKTAANVDTGTYGPLLINLSAAESDTERNDAFSGASLFNTDINAAPDNLMVFGLGATQLSCLPPTPVEYDAGYFGKVPGFQQTSPPSIWIVAQTSGSQSFVQNNSALGSINVELDRPATLSKVTSWLPSTD